MMQFKTSVLLVLMIILGQLTAWSEVVLEIERRTVVVNTEGNIINLNMYNTEEAVATFQVDIMFDTDCFTVTGVNETNRSENMDILQYSNIEGGVRIALTGIGHQINHGSGPAVEIVVDVGICMEGEYPWDITDAVIADPSGGEIIVSEMDSYIEVVRSCDPLVHLSPTEFDFGDVWIGQAGTGTLFISNVGCGATDVYIETEGCADVNPTQLLVEASATQNVTVYCHAVKKGQCIGTLFIECFGGTIEVSVTCNGVIPTGTKGDVNNDGVINILDAVLCINDILALWPFEDPSRIWAADCNGPHGNCDGDGATNALDAIKIVNLILELDECLPDNVIYFNSFELDSDTAAWQPMHPDMFVNDPAPGGGRKSLYIGGGCRKPTSFFILPLQPSGGIYMLSCWGKTDESDVGTLYLTTSDVHNDSTTIRLMVDSPDWHFLQTEESLYCSPEDTMRIEIWIGGFVPQAMYIDLLKVEKVE